VSTFNFLCDEKRYVAGAFIPPSKVETSEDVVYLDDNRSSAENDMLKVMERMARLKDKQFKRLPDESGDKEEQ